MNPCLSCSKTLFETVAYCPFCGKPTDAKRVAAAVVAEAVPPAPVRPVAPEPSAPKHVDAPPPHPAVAQPSVIQASASAVAAAGDAGERMVAPAKRPATQEPISESASRVAQSARDEKRPGGFRKLVRNLLVGGVALMAVFGYFSYRSNQKQADCEQSLASAQQLLSGGNLDAGRQQGTHAQLICDGPRAAAASRLLVEIEQTRTLQARACVRGLDRVRSALGSARLRETQTAIERMPEGCSTVLELATLRQQLAQANAAADTADAAVQKAIASGDAIAATTALDMLARADSTRSDLAQLRAQIAAIPKPGPVASVVSTAPPLAQPAIASQPYHSTPRPQPDPSPSVPNQSAIARQFLVSAMNELAQNHFDAARTFVESARKVDPGNPNLARMLKTIQAREHQLLQDETTIN